MLETLACLSCPVCGLDTYSGIEGDVWCDLCKIGSAIGYIPDEISKWLWFLESEDHTLEQPIAKSVIQQDATEGERRAFQSDCELPLAPSDIQFFKEDGVTTCGLLIQTTSHQFIGTLCILKEVLTPFAVLSKALQHGELTFAALLSPLSYCLPKLDDIMRRKDDILVTLGDDLAENGKFGLARLQITEASNNFITGLIQLI